MPKPKSDRTSRKRFSYTPRDMWLHYALSRHRHGKDYISEDQYVQVANRMMHLMLHDVIYHAKNVILPYKLGHIFVKAMKCNLKLHNNSSSTEIKMPDWETTMSQPPEYRKLTYHTSLKSSGYYYRIFWDKSYVRWQNRGIYHLRISSKWRSKLHERVEELCEDSTKKSYPKR